MSTPAQITANIQNAQHSTGPRTDAGKSACAKNAITLGLFTSSDFIKPGEEPIYAALREDLLQELAPQGILENTLVNEIRRSTWRLRRCGEVEACLSEPFRPGAQVRDPMETPYPHHEKIQKSVDRARSQAHRLLHKCTAELRKLQAERYLASKTQPAAAPTTKTVGLFCNPQSVARNAACPCQSGQKYKRCCGKAAAPLVRAA